MRNKKKLLLVTILIIFLFLIIAISIKVINIEKVDANIRKALYGDPIDLETGIINNEYFNISSNREKCH